MCGCNIVTSTYQLCLYKVCMCGGLFLSSINCVFMYKICVNRGWNIITSIHQLFVCLYTSKVCLDVCWSLLHPSIICIYECVKCLNPACWSFALTSLSASPALGVQTGAATPFPLFSFNMDACAQDRNFTALSLQLFSSVSFHTKLFPGSFFTYKPCVPHLYLEPESDPLLAPVQSQSSKPVSPETSPRAYEIEHSVQRNQVLQRVWGWRRLHLCQHRARQIQQASHCHEPFPFLFHPCRRVRDVDI